MIRMKKGSHEILVPPGSMHETQAKLDGYTVVAPEPAKPAEAPKPAGK